MMKADVELGGTRSQIQFAGWTRVAEGTRSAPPSRHDVAPAEGTDGVNKMSKSLGNTIGTNEPPDEIFGKLMSLSDTLMWRYLELLSAEDMRTIEKWKREAGEGANPRDVANQAWLLSRWRERTLR